MKNYRAIYNTETIENCMYDFQAQDDYAAITYAKCKFSEFGQETFRIMEGDREIGIPRYAIRHSTKGFYQNSHNWIQDPSNAYNWAKRFTTIEDAEKVAQTLTSISGKPLRTQVVVLNHPKRPYGFESYKVVK